MGPLAKCNIAPAEFSDRSGKRAASARQRRTPSYASAFGPVTILPIPVIISFRRPGRGNCSQTGEFAGERLCDSGCMRFGRWAIA